MLIHEAREAASLSGALKLKDCIKLSHTLSFARKCDEARRALVAFFEKAKNPVISCGGGKDSTATAILARQVNPDALILCADPPNPLSDREKHVADLRSWIGGSFISVPYDWNVAAVMSGKKPYPEGLKMRVLTRWHTDHDVDGVILGLRQSESRSRKIVFRSRGYVYRTQRGWRCIPVAKMTAEEVLCVALKHDAPINPVYTRQRGDIPFEYIRDGTWWPHGFTDISSWIKEYYPEHYEDHIQAQRIYDAHKSRVCNI